MRLRCRESRDVAPHRRPRRARAPFAAAGLAAGLALGAGPAAAAGAAPVPPCAGAQASPAYAPAGPAPALATWQADELPPGWRFPACTGWSGEPKGRLVAATGRLEANGVETILERLGAVSRYPSIRYWSAKRQQWRVMLDDAFALSGPSAEDRRQDFRAAEFVPGATLHVAYDDAEPVGPVVEALTVRERSPDRLAIETSNVTAARMMGFPVARAGDMRMVLFFDREAPGLWRYYALSDLSLSLPGGGLSEADYLNRAAALFRFTAGLPTDAMPPPASG